MLNGKRFAVLGLGDTNYDKFCACAKLVHKRMGELGGSEFYKLTLADEPMGLEPVVDPWVAGLWPALATVFQQQQNGAGEGVVNSSQQQPHDCATNKEPHSIVAVTTAVAATTPSTGAAPSTSPVGATAVVPNQLRPAAAVPVAVASPDKSHPTAADAPVTTTSPRASSPSSSAPPSSVQGDETRHPPSSPMSMIRQLQQTSRRIDSSGAATAATVIDVSGRPSTDVDYGVPPRRASLDPDNDDTHRSHSIGTQFSAALLRSHTSEMTTAAIRAAEAAVTSRGRAGSAMSLDDRLEAAAAAAATASGAAMRAMERRRRMSSVGRESEASVAAGSSSSSSSSGRPHQASLHSDDTTVHRVDEALSAKQSTAADHPRPVASSASALDATAAAAPISALSIGGATAPLSTWPEEGLESPGTPVVAARFPVAPAASAAPASGGAGDATVITRRPSVPEGVRAGVADNAPERLAATAHLRISASPAPVAAAAAASQLQAAGPPVLPVSPLSVNATTRQLLHQFSLDHAAGGAQHTPHFNFRAAEIGLTPGVRSVHDLFPNIKFARFTAAPPAPPASDTAATVLASTVVSSAGAAAAPDSGTRIPSSDCFSPASAEEIVVLPYDAPNVPRFGFMKLPTCAWSVLKIDAPLEAAAVPTTVLCTPSSSSSSSVQHLSGDGATAELSTAAAAAATPAAPPSAPAPASSAPAAAVSKAQPGHTLPPLGHSVDAPVSVPVTHARYLTALAQCSLRRIVAMDMDVSNTPLQGGWSPGDAIGVIAPNPTHIVDALCARLGWSPSALVDVVPMGEAMSATAASASSAAAATTSAAKSSSSAATAPSLYPPWMMAELGRAASSENERSSVGGSAAATLPVASASAAAVAADVTTDVTDVTHASPSAIDTAIAVPASRRRYPTLRDVFSWCVEIMSPPRKSLLRVLAEYALDVRERDLLMHLSGRAGKSMWQSFVEEQQLHVLDVLCLFPSSTPPLAMVLSALHAPLPPRYYSVASSPLRDRNTITVAFSVVYCLTRSRTTADGDDITALDWQAQTAMRQAEDALAQWKGGPQQKEDAERAVAVEPGASAATTSSVGDRSVSTPMHSVELLTAAASGGFLPPRGGLKDREVRAAALALSPLSPPLDTLPSSVAAPLVTPSAASAAAAAARVGSGGLDSTSSSAAPQSLTADGSPSHVLEGQSAVAEVTAAAAATAASAAEVSLPPTIVRFGLATTWLERQCAPLIRAAQSSSSGSGKTPSPLTTTVNKSAAGGALPSSHEAALAAHNTTSSTSSACIASPPLLRIFLRANTAGFTLPANPERPIIMIGPGTGVAPFIGFLQHRAGVLARVQATEAAMATGMWRRGCHVAPPPHRNDPDTTKSLLARASLGPALLFFGCRSAKTEFLFERELDELRACGALTELHTAFSRDGPPGAPHVHVHHRLVEAGARLAELILCREAHIYVCGDGLRMAKDVHAALVALLAEHGPALTDDGSGVLSGRVSSPLEAEMVLAAAARSGRYSRDIWLP